LALRINKRPFNWTYSIIPVLFLISAISLINLRNADFYSGDIFHQKQVVWYLVGIITLVIVALIDIKVFEGFSWFFYGFGILLLVLTMIFGTTINNSKRWIELGFFNLQASEMVKISVIVNLAAVLKRLHRPEGHSLKSLWQPALIFAGPALLILAQPDLGTALLVGLTVITMILYEGVRWRSLLLIIGVFLLLFPLAWKFDLIHDYQKDRVRLWLNPEQFKWDEKNRKLLDKTLQPEQALWAVGAGGFLGKGSFQASKTRLKYLPEMQTDFILATYAEEHGFLGCAVLGTLFLLLFLWGAHVAREARDRFGVLLAVGCTAYLFWQTTMNIGMVIGLFPVVGITLPFFSYGGSSLVSVMIAVGLLINVSLHQRRQ